MSLQDRRKEIIRKIIATMNKADCKDKILDLNKIAAAVSYENGCTLRMAKEYVKIAEMMR